MICIPIIEKNNEDSINHMRVAEKVADVIELRLDHVESPVLSELLVSKKPVIVTCRKKAEGGFFEGSEESRIRLLKKALDLQPAYLDIELSIGEKAIKELILKKGKTKIIVSHHDFKSTPDLKSLLKIFSDIERTGCDITKLAVFANDIVDNVRLYEAAKLQKKPIIALCMGEKGELSRILYRKFNSMLTYASLEVGKESAPGQVSFDLMKNIYRADKLDEDTQILGTIGKPARHSRSFYMFNPVYETLGQNRVHLKFEVDNLGDFIREIKKLNPGGFAVTTPFKEEVLRYLDEIDKAARFIGAVNTIVIRNGKCIGYNTDGTGAKMALEEKTNIKGKRVVILGAGGAAKAIADILSQEKCEIHILNRTLDKSKEIAQRLKCKFGTLQDIEKTDYDIMINCTTVGMSPDSDASPVEKKYLKGIVMDAVYKPPITRLLKESGEASCVTVDGLTMLFYQALDQYKLWTGMEPPREHMREALWKSLSRK